MKYKDQWKSLFVVSLFPLHPAPSVPQLFLARPTFTSFYILRYSNKFSLQQSRCIPLLSSFPSSLLLRLLFLSRVVTSTLSVCHNTAIRFSWISLLTIFPAGYKYSGGGCTDQTLINADPIFGTGNVCQPLNRNEGSPSVVSYKAYSAAAGCVGEPRGPCAQLASSGRGCWPRCGRRAALQRPPQLRLRQLTLELVTVRERVVGGRGVLAWLSKRGGGGGGDEGQEERAECTAYK